ncbi:MAG: site-specific integrase [Actinobacteria bacterium]|nr:site-specific integrase [Actinomycetota bacterium]
MSIHKRETTKGTRYDVKLRDPHGRMYQRSFRTKREAEAWQANELSDRTRGMWVDPRGGLTPVSEWASEWLISNPAKRPGSIARDEAVIRVHLKPAFGHRPLGSITSRDIQHVVNAWSATQAPRTVRRHYAVLRAIFNAAVEAELLWRSPCRGIKLPAVQPDERYIVDGDELAALAAAMGEDYGPLAYLGAVLGLRWGECAGLKVGRLDFLRSTLMVAWQRTRGPGGVMVEGPPKSNAGRRTIAVPAPLMEMLSRHLARRKLTGAHVDAYVFTAPHGGPLDYSHFRDRIWLPACRAVGLPKLRFHDLRHANATGLVADGVDIKTAQTRLGHSDPRLTLAI